MRRQSGFGVSTRSLNWANLLQPVVHWAETTTDRLLWNTLMKLQKHCPNHLLLRTFCSVLQSNEKPTFPVFSISLLVLFLIPVDLCKNFGIITISLWHSKILLYRSNTRLTDGLLYNQDNWYSAPQWSIFTHLKRLELLKRVLNMVGLDVKEGI